eukprot:gene10276-59048_t
MIGFDWVFKHLTGYGTAYLLPQSDRQVVLMTCIALASVLGYAYFLGMVATYVTALWNETPH